MGEQPETGWQIVSSLMSRKYSATAHTDISQQRVREHSAILHTDISQQRVREHSTTLQTDISRQRVREHSATLQTDISHGVREYSASLHTDISHEVREHGMKVRHGRNAALELGCLRVFSATLTSCLVWTSFSCSWVLPLAMSLQSHQRIYQLETDWHELD
jgi:hypothetical protein